MNGMTYLATEATGAIGMTEAVTTLFSVATSAITMVTENPTLMVFFCAGLAFTGIAIVKRLK